MDGSYRRVEAPPGTLAARRNWLRTLVWPGLGFVMVLVAIRFSGLDLRMADVFFDPQAATFPARHDHVFKKLLHDGGDRLVIAVALLALGGYVASFVAPPLRRQRRAALFVVVCIVATTASVAVGKRYSNVDCPWALARYGGDRPYVHLFERRPPALPRAHCFPGAHSSGAFAFGAFAFLAWHAGRRRTAAALLAGALLVGAIYAATQWARGAHFVSHDVWSAWIAWSVCVVCYRALLADRRRDPSPPPRG